MKLLELALLQKFKKEIKEKNLIHENQIGFEEGHQCTEHIQTMIHIVQKQKQYEQDSIRLLAKNPTRQKRFLFFIDFRKAFDVVNRRKMLQNLKDKEVSNQLISSIRMLLTNTTAEVNGETVPIEKGVMQGGCMSP